MEECVGKGPRDSHALTLENQWTAYHCSATWVLFAPALASPGSLLEMQNPWPHTDWLHRNLHFYYDPRVSPVHLKVWQALICSICSQGQVWWVIETLCQRGKKKAFLPSSLWRPSEARRKEGCRGGQPQQTSLSFMTTAVLLLCRRTNVT